MADEPAPAWQRLIDKISNSRDFIISLVIHVILVVFVGGIVFYKAVQEPTDFEGSGSSFVQTSDTPPPPQSQSAQSQTPSFNVATISSLGSQVDTITTTSQTPLEFDVATVKPAAVATTATSSAMPPPPKMFGNGASMPASVAAEIKAFTGGWGKGEGVGTGLRSREFQFTAYIGEYEGGNWKSTIRELPDGTIQTGSLPNLLYFMSLWSKDKIKTNYKQVKAIPLDSDELFTIKPPFIFLTGTRDFKLTDLEVANLQKYVRIGGCIWGDSSVPGLRSSFDIAFRREMKRVIPDVDKDFEPLPADHPIFAQNYFSEVNGVPSGLNYYRLPVYALKIYGEIAILYTANDYGDMWQIGLDSTGQIDMRKNARNGFVAINRPLLLQNNIYVRNLDPGPLTLTYKFGTNVVVHLLTRWENKVKMATQSL